MKLKSLSIVCLVLLLTASASAQSSSATDLISGAWKGDVGPSETTRFPILMTLKVDGQGAISGLITGTPQPGEIKTGSFDPRTGALKLEVEVKGDGSVIRVNFDGTMVNGVAIGRVNGPGVAGDFKITKGGGDSPAQQPNGINTATALRKSFSEVSSWVVKAADLVPADKYSYKPTQSVRTYGQLIAHIADSYNYYCAAASGAKVQWSDAIEKSPADKATLVQKLKQATSACEAAYGGGQSPPLIENIGHTNLHYGNIITYMRMMGLTPPSS